MKAVSLISKILENYIDLTKCGIHTFEGNVKNELKKYIGDFYTGNLPKPKTTYFYQWIDVTCTPAIPEPDALILQDDEGTIMAIYFWEVE